jgi:hypothetical protein
MLAPAAGREKRMPLRAATPLRPRSGRCGSPVYGRDEAAVEAGNLLRDHLDITVLIAPPAAIPPPRGTDFPVAQGRIRTATGHLGAFDVVVDAFAQPAPSSRDVLSF